MSSSYLGHTSSRNGARELRLTQRIFCQCIPVIKFIWRARVRPQTGSFGLKSGRLYRRGSDEPGGKHGSTSGRGAGAHLCQGKPLASGAWGHRNCGKFAQGESSGAIELHTVGFHASHFDPVLRRIQRSSGVDRHQGAQKNGPAELILQGRLFVLRAHVLPVLGRECWSSYRHRLSIRT